MTKSTSPRLLPTILLTATLLVTLPGCGKEEQSKGQGQQAAPQVVTISLAPAKQQPVERTVDVVGTLFGDEEAQISAKVPGRVTRLFVDVGDRVKSGAPLAQIDPVDYELAKNQTQTLLQQSLAKLGLREMPGDDFDPDSVPTVRQARVQSENAQARYRRTEKLFNQQPPLISEQEYADARTAADVAQAAYDVAVLGTVSTIAEARTRQAELRLAERRLAEATVRAPESDPPRDYAISARQVSVGEYLKDGSVMFRVVADNPIRYRVSVPEKFLSEVKQGQSVSVLVEAAPEPARGKVSRINPQVDPAARSFQVEILVDNPTGVLRPGAFARGAITTRTQENVTFVPQEAVVSFAGTRKVFTVKDGKAQEHQVTTGIRSGNLVEIVTGLQGAPEVVISGASRLANATPVQISSTPATIQATK